MHNRILSNFPGILLFLLLLVTVYTTEIKWFSPKSESITEADSLWSKYKSVSLKFFPDASKMEGTRFEAKKIYNLQSEYIGCLLVSADIGIKVYGYAGEIPLIIAIDKQNKVVGLVVPSHNETPGFFAQVENSGLLIAWNNSHINNALKLKVDAVSGATYTSQAIITVVKKTLSWYANVEENRSKTDWGLFFKWISISIMLAFALLHFFFPGYFKKTRILLQVSTILIIGFWTGNFISVALLYGWLMHGINFGITTILALLFIVSIILPFVTGKAFYCNFVCPYGSCQELAALTPVKKIQISAKLAKWLRSLRLLLFFVVLIYISYANTKANLAQIEPFQAFMLKTASLFFIGFALLFVLASIFIHRPWCNYFCMTGQFFEFFRKPKLLFSWIVIRGKNYSIAFLITIVIIIFILGFLR